MPLMVASCSDPLRWTVRAASRMPAGNLNGNLAEPGLTFIDRVQDRHAPPIATPVCCHTRYTQPEGRKFHDVTRYRSSARPDSLRASSCSDPACVSKLEPQPGQPAVPTPVGRVSPSAAATDPEPQSSSPLSPNSAHPAQSSTHPAAPPYRGHPQPPTRGGAMPTPTTTALARASGTPCSTPTAADRGSFTARSSSAASPPTSPPPPAATRPFRQRRRRGHPPAACPRGAHRRRRDAARRGRGPLDPPPPHQPRPHHARPLARPRARRAPRRARPAMRSDPASASTAQPVRSQGRGGSPSRLARPKVGTGRPACSFKCVRHRRGHQGRSAPPAVVCPAGKTLTPAPAADLPLAFRDRAPQIRPGGMQ